MVPGPQRCNRGPQHSTPSLTFQQLQTHNTLHTLTRIHCHLLRMYTIAQLYVLIHEFTLTPTYNHTYTHTHLLVHIGTSHTLTHTFKLSHRPPHFHTLSHPISHTYTPFTHKIPCQVRSDSFSVIIHPRAEGIFSVTVNLPPPSYHPSRTETTRLLF